VKQEKIKSVIKMVSESLQTSKADFVKIFPSLKELSLNYQEDVYVPKLKDVGHLDAPK